MGKRGFWINDRAAIRLLAKAFLKKEKKRNQILSGAVALGVLVLCVVFGIAAGKVDTEYISSLRSKGTLACTYLEDGTVSQYTSIQTLSYIEATGWKKTVGTAYEGETLIGDLVMLDESAWEDLTVPALGEIKGEYPKKAEEIMLPLDVLESLGIKEPQMGQKITLKIMLGLFEEQTEDFTLCGWYSDYVEKENHIPQCYISREKLKEWGIDEQKAEYILIKQKDDLSGEKVEEKLYEDIPTVNETQQFIGGDTIKSQVLENFVGGCIQAGVWALILLLSVFLVIVNVFGISLSGDIRQMGQLTCLGATKRQIKKIYYRQMNTVLLWGLLTGVVCSAVVMVTIVPKLLQKLYLYQMGEVSYRYIFRPQIFVAAAVAVILTFLGACSYVIRKTVNMPPWEAIRYTGVFARKREGRRRKKRRQNRKEIFRMAVQNVLRNPKQFRMTVISLSLGVCVALGAVVITKGMDKTNEIAKTPDFSIRGNGILVVSEEGDWPHLYEEFSPISEGLKEKILSLHGRKQEKTTILQGFYMENMYGDAALKPLTDSELDRPMSEEEHAQYTFTITNLIRVVDDDYVQKLQDYVQKNNLKTDMDLFVSGDGILLLHDHALSPAMEEAADEVIGADMTFEHLMEKEEWEKRLSLSIREVMQLPDVQKKTETIKMAGYLDVSREGFPMPDGGIAEDLLYFLVTEKGAQRLHAKVKTLGFELDVEEKQERAAKAQIEQMLQEENAKDEYLGLNLTAKSDQLAQARNLILTNRVLMGGIGGILIAMGVLNYLYVIAMGMVSREREFYVLGSIGMTEKQKRRMLLYERLVYWGVVLLTVLVFGMVVLKLLGVYMESQVEYFRFFWPWKEFVGVMAVLGGICVGVRVRKRGT